MPRRKEKPLTWDWRIGALRCKRRIQVPGSISDRLGIEYPEARKLWKEIAEEIGGKPCG
jgi:hypothetical protein